nr:MAG TPA: homing endonuclease [Caudoviricetes sp.]
MKTETWKPIADYVGLYEVSNKGRVRNLKTGRTLKPGNNGRGYLFVGLYKNGAVKYHYLHRLVALTFIPNPNKLPEVNHKDEIRTNNKLDNLEWISHRDNSNYGKRNERVSKSKSKAIVQFDLSTGLIIKTYSSTITATRVTGINQGNISKAARGIIKTAGGYGWRYQSDKTN